MTAGVLFPAGARHFPVLHTGTHPVALRTLMEALSLGLKRPGRKPDNPVLGQEWKRFTSTSLVHGVMLNLLINNRDDFTLFCRIDSEFL
jgi:hypothetical protein